MPQHQDTGSAAIVRWDGGLCWDGENLCDYCEWFPRNVVHKINDPFYCTRHGYGIVLETAISNKGEEVPVRHEQCQREFP